MEKRLKEAGKQEQFYSIALFDILGFSNYVTTHGNQTILELYNKLLDIVYTPDIGKVVPIRMSDDWKEGQYIANANGHVNVCHISDTFIIYVHYLCRREAYWLTTPKYEPYPLLLGEKDTPYCPIFLSRTSNLFIVLTDLYGLFLPINYCGDSFAWLCFFWLRTDGFQQIRCCGGSVLYDFLAAHNFSFTYNQILLSLTHNLLRRRFRRPGSFLPEILTRKENRRTPFQYVVINPCMSKVWQVLNLFQFQVCCDNQRLLTPISAVNDSEHLLHGILATALHS